MNNNDHFAKLNPELGRPAFSATVADLATARSIAFLKHHLVTENADASEAVQ